MVWWFFWKFKRICWKNKRILIKLNYWKVRERKIKIEYNEVWVTNWSTW